MAIQVKRVGGAVAELMAPQQEEEQGSSSSEELRQAAREEAAAQLLQYREQAIVALRRMGKGLVLWQEKGWQWEEPDWAADPESWPPLARLLYLLHRSQTAMTRANWLRHFKEHPEWCTECQPEAPSPQHVGAHCEAKHVNHAEAVRTLARDLGWME